MRPLPTLAYGLLALPLAFAALPLYVHVPAFYANVTGLDLGLLGAILLLARLLDAGIDTVGIVNRSPERADALSDRLGEPGRVHTRYWDDLPNLGVFDMIVNATSAGRSTATMSLPSSLATARTLAVDLSYGEAAIAFLSWDVLVPRAGGEEGGDQLLEQAAEAFRLWRGLRSLMFGEVADLRAALAG